MTLAALLFALLGETVHPAPAPLALLQSLPIESSDSGLHLSALSLCDGTLLTLSDRHDRQVYRLEIDPTAALARTQVWRTLSPPAPADWGWRQRVSSWFAGRLYDWEGIACRGDRLYLLSEQLNDLLISSNRGESWLQLPRQQFVNQGGVLRSTNAGLEGLTFNGQGLVLAAEREARGLLQFVPEKGGWQLQWLHSPLPPEPPLAGRSPDFSGLWFESPWLYTLERNLFRICRRDTRFQQQRCWSYADTELAPERRYRTEFGVAEGIAADAQRIYLITDNNGDARVADADDRRPQLWIFAKPADWRE
ncbi:esterase-like activity of phytase family protein [Aestuariirhabdus litorea]|uniref:Phytase-like domain-containing protein n=1 Tax=Aestuariirhabdus litorea TaxID=2528527 RepID=A0A3P3VHV7_9GAMM|nr:esterase-like activity of phytase family protein [Aestuariirhabdus litorea]RRJ82300.1 hypothetical protein D0544_10455 [Aestuariirhabdus litorea]RWW92466.1 hypothetical protein DZC74_10435 [Endozoicomonadaceae bacterium GTF-13]